ncbi:MAG: DegT/DnrJ/EryC1/StrS family aminotransferase [Candidatus Rokuibacteriota bacterium]|nr:MAG: DegT/DnrJ/EryC1/StrS family aminotransferase [Candidatus Rokubacteria bacterium]
MTESRTVLAARIRALVEEYFALPLAPPGPGQARLPLHVPSYGAEEVNEAIASLLSTHVTMGEKVRRFEALWAEYLGVAEAVMVNSGSSANLVAVAALVNPALPRPLVAGDEVVVPAVAWSTTYFPLVNAGLVPVLVDVDLDTFTIDPAAVAGAIGPRTRALLPVHLLGNACDMRALGALAARHDLVMIEDACEAHGARFEGRPVGTFGAMGTFSFYFSHHISTIEGGMVVTDDPTLADLARMLRAHGWIRDVKRRPATAGAPIDERFLFVNLGYNLRPTELQGAFGMHQMAKLEPFIKIRRDNVEYWNAALRRHARWLRECPGRDTAGSRAVWFGYPITVRPEAPFSRDDLTRFLESRRIETRPIMAGNFRDQPAIRLFPHRLVGGLDNAALVMRQSFFIGNHHAITERDRDYVVACLDEFMAKWA